jgi:hypothetical protein
MDLRFGENYAYDFMTIIVTRIGLHLPDSTRPIALAINPHALGAEGFRLRRFCVDGSRSLAQCLHERPDIHATTSVLYIESFRNDFLFMF